MVSAPSTPPPLLSPPAMSPGLSILTGVAGLIASVGAAVGGFTEQLLGRGLASYAWGQTLLFAGVAAFIGSVLALAIQDVGPPIVAGASSVILGVVFTTLTAERIDLSRDIFDVWPVRGLLFTVGGVAAVAAVVLGLIAPKGRGNRALGAVIAVLSLGWLASVAIQLRLDDRRDGYNVKPFLAFAAIAAVAIIGALVGRFGALAAATGIGLVVPRMLEAVEFGEDRRPAHVGSLSAASAAVALAAVAAILDSRQTGLTYIGPVEPLTAWPPAEPLASNAGASPRTDQYPVVPPVARAIPEEQSPFAAPEYGPDYVVAGAATQPLEMVGAVHPAPRQPESRRVSAVPQWAPDPYGRHHLRYWDGSRWTGDVQDGGVASSDPV